MFEQQEILYFAYTNLGLHMQFEIVRRNTHADKGAHTNWRPCTKFCWPWTAI